MEEPGRFHDATLVRIRQPDRTGGAVSIAPILLRGGPFLETSLQLQRKSALGQPKCRVSDSSNALIPFQAICTPMQTRKNDDNCVITVIPVAPRICAKRSANP
jgi:hypothetical protein